MICLYKYVLIIGLSRLSQSQILEKWPEDAGIQFGNFMNVKKSKNDAILYPFSGNDGYYAKTIPGKLICDLGTRTYTIESDDNFSNGVIKKFIHKIDSVDVQAKSLGNPTLYECKKAPELGALNYVCTIKRNGSSGPDISLKFDNKMLRSKRSSTFRGSPRLFQNSQAYTEIEALGSLLAAEQGYYGKEVAEKVKGVAGWLERALRSTRQVNIDDLKTNEARSSATGSLWPNSRRPTEERLIPANSLSGTNCRSSSLCPPSQSTCKTTCPTTCSSTCSTTCSTTTCSTTSTCSTTCSLGGMFRNRSNRRRRMPRRRRRRRRKYQKYVRRQPQYVDYGRGG